MSRRAAERAATLRASDALHARAAARLEAIVLALEGAPEAELREGLAGLAAFARELRVIVEPRRPVALRLAEVDLVELVARALSPAQAGPRGVVVELSRSGALRGEYDAGHLETVLGELLSNAMKYAGGGAVHLSLRAARGRATLAIDNPGAWAGPRRAPQRFVREERRAHVEGFGVGLWLVGRLVRAHGGSVRYACKEGRTYVTVSLPLSHAPDDGALTATVASTPRPAGLGRPQGTRDKASR